MQKKSFKRSRKAALIFMVPAATLVLQGCGAEKAVEAYSRVASESKTTLVVPSNMSEVSALIGTAMTLLKSGKVRGVRFDTLERIWQNIRDHHLTLGGGPWGGVAHRSREVFNARGSFSPNAYVETCSLLSWIQFNRELLRLTGEARFAEEIERTAYNDLLAAMPIGERTAVMACSTVSARITPLPAASPSAFTTMGAPLARM